MTLAEYTAAQAVITAALVRLVLAVLVPFAFGPLQPLAWLGILRTIYPSMVEARRQSAILARSFYDSRREVHTGTDERHDINLPTYDFLWLEEALRPAFKHFESGDNPQASVVITGLRVAKEVENAGRRLLIRGAQSDPFGVRWARVATGKETCAFCLMLVSRGPVYLSADTAGFRGAETDGFDLGLNLMAARRNNRLNPTADNFARVGDVEETFDDLMRKWHPGCDCKVVPVFDERDWEGREEFLAAEDLWKDVTKGYKGNDALNALRRAVERGQVNPADFAAAA